MAKYEERIKELEELISKSKYNKRTQHAIGLYKAQLARLKEKQTARSKKRKGEGYSVRKTGDGTVIILGFPSVGKSTLLNDITDANSPIGSYEFTTLTVIPGILEHKYAKIQVLDVPGVVKGAASGRGRGTEVLAVLRSANLILILLDVNHPGHLKVLLKELYDAGIRINQEKPDVKIRKTAKDGIRIGKTVKLKRLDDPTIKDILKTFRINNAEVLIRTSITDDQLIDCIEANKKYVPAIIILNKIDTQPEERVREIAKATKADLCVSAEKKEHIDELKDLIYEKLNLISIYMKEPGKPADLEEPLIMFKECTIRDVCEKLHKDFVAKFKFCRVWGKSAKFDGQKLLRLDHTLKDNDVLEIHLT
jgi:small GTP-binding protein